MFCFPRFCAGSYLGLNRFRFFVVAMLARSCRSRAFRAKRATCWTTRSRAFVLGWEPIPFGFMDSLVFPWWLNSGFSTIAETTVPTHLRTNSALTGFFFVDTFSAAFPVNIRRTSLWCVPPSTVGMWLTKDIDVGACRGQRSKPFSQPTDASSTTSRAAEGASKTLTAQRSPASKA